MPQVTEDEYRKLYPETLRIYDPRDDAFRDATQEDLDRHIEIAAAYGALMDEIFRRRNTLGNKLGWPTLIREMK